MSITDALKQVGNRLGLIKIVALPTPEKPQKITTRTITMKELTTEIQAAEIKLLAELPAELSVDFAQVFTTAGVKPAAHGWTVEKLQELLNTEPYKGGERKAIQQKLLELMQSQKVPVEDLVKDAMSRDQAIDAFGAFVHQKMMARKEARRRDTVELEGQIQGLRDQINRLQTENQIDRTHWVEWWQKKLAYERQLAAAINYLLDKPVVTIDETPPPDNNSH